jgi:hypothetical protein
MIIFVCFCILLRFLINTLKETCDLVIYNLSGRLQNNFENPYNIVLINSEDGEEPSREQPESRGEQADPNHEEPENEEPEDEEPEDNMDLNSNDSGISDVENELSDVSDGEGKLQPEKDDIDQVYLAQAGDPQALAEIQEKYHAFFDGVVHKQNALTDIENYILSETNADPATPSENPSSPENPVSQNASESRDDGNNSSKGSPENHVSQNVSGSAVNSSNLEQEQLSDLEGGRNVKDDSSKDKAEETSEAYPVETSTKRARSESTSDVEGNDRKRTKTKHDDDDDDSNNNPPKGGGSLRGFPPTEGGDTNSGEGSSSSSSKFTSLFLINLGLFIDQLQQILFPPF